jgi:hypothetical protein
MHPYHTIYLAHEHIAEMQSTSARVRFARRARRGRGARSPAPQATPDLVALSFLNTPDERRPAV